MAPADRSFTLTMATARGFSSASTPRLSLMLEQPGRARQVKRLGLSPLVVGSSAECELVCEDPGVSRTHCRFELTPEGIVVTDLGSKNGTHVQGLRIREILLTQPATVRLGSSTVQLTVEAGEEVIPLSASNRFGDAFGVSVAMRAVFSTLERAAASDLPVLLQGESGTGKELLARALHTTGPRADQAFVVVDCAALTEQLAEAELFGYEVGAFTGAVRAHVGLLEQADGGTLFLDEVDALSPALQPRFLRALESRKVRPLGADEERPARFRIVAAARAGAGALREDLKHRIAGVEVRIPPLRERKEDIPLLVEQMLRRMDPPRRLADLPSNAIDLLMSHAWTGNVRELRNTVTRWALFPELSRSPARASETSPPTSWAPWGHLPLREARDAAVESFERSFVTGKLEAAGGNVAAAARDMDVSRQYLYRLLSRYGIRGNE